MLNDAAWVDGERVECSFDDYSHAPKYRCHVAIMQDDDDLYSAIVLNLPGAGSCGATADEALEHVREAVAGVIEAYRSHGAAIPWIEPESYRADIPPNSQQKWILVDA